MDAYDFKTVDGALYIDPVTGDLVIAPSDVQHISDIIRSNKGEWKQYPAVGVGVMLYLNSGGKEQELEREIKIQLQADGYTVNSPRVKYNIGTGDLQIQPNAIR